MIDEFDRAVCGPSREPPRGREQMRPLPRSPGVQRIDAIVSIAYGDDAEERRREHQIVVVLQRRRLRTRRLHEHAVGESPLLGLAGTYPRLCSTLDVWVASELGARGSD